MSRRLYISLIFSDLVVFKTLSSNHRMYNRYTKLSKYLRYASNSLKISSMNRVMFLAVVLFLSFLTWKWWHCPWQQRQRALIVRSGCSTINCKNTRTIFPISYQGDSSMTAGRKRQACVRNCANIFELVERNICIFDAFVVFLITTLSIILQFLW